METAFPATEPGRHYFLDNLRTAVIILVVFHHAAMVYGAFAPFYYTEQPFVKVLMNFCIINQSWFMGFLFLLSGYFTPASLKRKETVRFVKEKLIRLGIPVLIFYFVLNPAASLGIYKMPAAVTGITSRPALHDYPLLTGLGPLWFAAMLLIFNLIYSFVSGLSGKNRKPFHLQGIVPVLLFAFFLGGVTYLWRIFVPIGKSIGGFPSLAYLPQYICFYAAGILMSGTESLQRISAGTGISGFIVFAVSLAVLFPLSYSGKLFSMELTPEFADSLGGGTGRSLVYAMWDSFAASGISIGLLYAFHKFFNRGSRLTLEMSRGSYTVYIIHCVLLVGIAVMLKSFSAPPVVKTAVLGFLTTAGSFAAAWILRKAF